VSRALLVAALLSAVPAAAGADGLDLEVATALKSALVVSRAPDAPLLFPERDTAVALWRLRLAPELTVGEHVTMSAAYEQRIRPAPQGMTLGLGVLPGEVAAPFRLTQLDWQIGSGSAYTWRHEIDRLAIAVHAGRLELTAGRQAVGWGRGVLFSAIDLFAPFSPLEADREWRRGVDAVRAEVTLFDTISADAMAAIGPSLDESAFAGRVRGYRGDVDLELVAGWRARDLMIGVTTSAAIRDAEVHGELAAFRTPEPPPAGAQLGQRGVVKAVVGGSYQLAIGNGVPVFVEYHYSGFGAVRARDVVALLAEPAFRARLERGDTQILGRHAITAYATYELGPELATGLRCIVSPRDGSGVLVPTATATLGDRLAVTAALYVPWGATPVDTTLQSEYGSAGLTGFVQLLATY
jgi:hypothetical protein